MSRSSASNLALASLGTLVFATSLARAEAPSATDASQRADVLATEATKAVERGDLERARTLLRESAALKPTYDTTGNLGAVELALKQYRDCAEHLAASVRDYPPTASDALKRTTLEKLGACRSHVAAAKLEVHPDGTTVTVDGAKVGTAPLADPLFLDPGTHVLGFQREGHESAQHSLVVTEGSERHLRVTLPPNTPAQAPSAAPMWPVVAGSVGTAVLLGAGVGAYLASSSAERDGDTTKAALAASGKHCPVDCADLIATYDSASARRNAATGLFVGAGLAAAGTAAYYLVFHPKPKPHSTALIPIFDRSQAGLLVQAEF